MIYIIIYFVNYSNITPTPYHIHKPYWICGYIHISHKKQLLNQLKEKKNTKSTEL